ncbi:hypothetical protein J26TS2_01180 [Shouchella clausii]|nr:hypothetical protein J26TS2_01180 [Shouchella clausii]
MNTLREVELVIQNHYFAVRRYVYREGSVPNPDIEKVAQEAASRVRDGEITLKKMRLKHEDRLHFSRLRNAFNFFAESLEVAAKGTNDQKALELSNKADEEMQIYALRVLGKAVNRLEPRDIS